MRFESNRATFSKIYIKSLENVRKIFTKQFFSKVVKAVVQVI
uniref:Uncharacterized protein n=1 Tax=viral metagenome TaxID=1070528 RepID=A0A6C0E0B2_9ZZZZ